MTHILIVDDDDAIRSAMEKYIRIHGFETASVASAEEAISYMENKANIDVVITDIMMEGMSGLELTDHIRSHHGNTSVIIMTGYSADYSYEDAIGRGASDIIFKPVRFEEVLLRLNRVLQEHKRTHELEVMIAQLQELSITDELTRLYNSRHFYTRIEEEMERCRRYKRPLSLLLLDIDHFKDYNDSFGHLEGDRVLVRMGKIIKSSLRAIDSAYRYGGEEFTILLSETDVNDSLFFANRIQKALIEEPFFPAISNEPVPMTMSIGATEYLMQESATSFIQRVDMAMYCSKKNGRNQITTLLDNRAEEYQKCLSLWPYKTRA